MHPPSFSSAHLSWGQPIREHIQAGSNHHISPPQLVIFLLPCSFFQPPSFLGFTTFYFPLPSSSLLLFFQPELFLLPHTFLPIFSVFVLLHLFLLCNFICRYVFLSSSFAPSGICSFILVLFSSFLPLLHLSRFFSQIIFPSPPFLTSFPVFLSLLSSLLFPELLLLLHVSIFFPLYIPAFCYVSVETAPVWFWLLCLGVGLSGLSVQPGIFKHTQPAALWGETQPVDPVTGSV